MIRPVGMHVSPCSRVCDDDAMKVTIFSRVALSASSRVDCIYKWAVQWVRWESLLVCALLVQPIALYRFPIARRVVLGGLKSLFVAAFGPALGLARACICSIFRAPWLERVRYALLDLFAHLWVGCGGWRLEVWDARFTSRGLVIGWSVLLYPFLWAELLSCIVRKSRFFQADDERYNNLWTGPWLEIPRKKLLLNSDYMLRYLRLPPAVVYAGRRQHWLSEYQRNKNCRLLTQLLCKSIHVTMM